jgi:hypothetical protein
MKKVLFILAGLLIIASGIMSVAAYEGHAVDVRAHVENAIMVNTNELDFGTVFPEALVERDVTVGLSESFVAQDPINFSSVAYKVYWEYKPITDPDPQHPVADPDNDTFYEPIWPYIELTCSDGIGDIPDDIKNANGVAFGAGSGSLFIPSDIGEGDYCDTWHLLFNVPVFDKWYNSITDPLKPSGILEEGQYYTETEYLQCDEKNIYPIQVPHIDMGGILKFQVTGLGVD